MLIQVDPKYTFYKAERGKPQVSAFDAEAWNAGAIDTRRADRRHLLHRRHRPAAHPLRDGSAEARVPGHAAHPRVARRRVITTDLILRSLCEARRLEGWATARQVATFETRTSCAPQGEA